MPRDSDSFPALAFDAIERLIIERPMPSLVEMFKPAPDFLAQLVELIALLQQSERFADHLAG